jgi:carboxymethylenebutenolidase
VPHDVKVYPGASHGFMNEFEGATRGMTRIMGLRYDPVATSDAWRRIFAFFGEHLGAGPGPGPADGTGG